VGGAERQRAGLLVAVYKFVCSRIEGHERTYMSNKTQARSVIPNIQIYVAAALLEC
jgi:hypothetical protein